MEEKTVDAASVTTTQYCGTVVRWISPVTGQFAVNKQNPADCCGGRDIVTSSQYYPSGSCSDGRQSYYVIPDMGIQATDSAASAQPAGASLSTGGKTAAAARTNDEFCGTFVKWVSIGVGQFTINRANKDDCCGGTDKVRSSRYRLTGNTCIGVGESYYLIPDM